MAPVSRINDFLSVFIIHSSRLTSVFLHAPLLLKTFINIYPFFFTVCKALVDEVEIAVDRVDPHKKVDMGSFRLDGKGNVKQNLVTSIQIHYSLIYNYSTQGSFFL